MKWRELTDMQWVWSNLAPWSSERGRGLDADQVEEYLENGVEKLGLGNWVWKMGV
jgi:calcineurin-like phosphoesterase